MSLLLNIDTAVPTASVCLSENGKAKQVLSNDDQKDHAAWLHEALRDTLKYNGHVPKDITAVAVTIGPGSYTGLRVGLATAKGLCYALQIPLITINTLQVIAYAVKEEATQLVIPLLDARRMEVYTAVYDKEIREKISTHTMILEPGAFSNLLSENKIIFCGNGIQKLRPLIHHPHAIFSDLKAHAGHLACLSQEKFVKKQFADLAYAEPYYLKEFRS